MEERGKKYKRVFLIVMDSVGIGGARDADIYGDEGADTLGHIGEREGQLNIPNLQRMGIGNLHKMKQVAPVEYPIGCYMRLAERSCGKDTMTGHWEMMGLHITSPFRTFSEDGFPRELIQELERRCGRKIIGNRSASGTEILENLAMEELTKGHLIVYTSADSVLQICGNEDTMGLEQLYHYCEIARELTMREEWRVGRVIARPYVGEKPGEFRRTANRHDYALDPYGETVLDGMKQADLDVISVGKIQDIFNGKGITQAYKSQSSVHGMQQSMELAKTEFQGLCFVNLVDFDALWGHRRNPTGYRKELETFDSLLGDFMGMLKEEDLLMITADHGNDPTWKGTDHTREQVPLLAWSPSMRKGKNLGEGDTFAIIGATIADNFQVKMPDGTIRKSILDQL